MHSSVSAGAHMSAPDETRLTCTDQGMGVNQRLSMDLR